MGISRHCPQTHQPGLPWGGDCGGGGDGDRGGGGDDGDCGGGGAGCF